MPLARGNKLEQFVELCIAEGLVDYLQMTLDIGVDTDPEVIWHKIMELMNMTMTIREETWPYIENTVDLQRLSQWLEEALDAQDLSQINFTPSNPGR